MMENRILQAYENAKEVYASYGVDIDKVLEKFDKIPVSIPCWQGDDIIGFESAGAGASGGLMVTGNYPGRPRNPEEYRMDLEKCLSYVPGALKVNLHSSYGENYESGIDRDEYAPRHFKSWVEWAKKNNVGLDMNATTFSHKYAADGLTISNPDETIRSFWVKHMQAVREIAEYIGKELGQPCVYNTWVQDGMKDMPANRMKYRELMKQSFDEIFSKKQISSEYVYDALEPKLFAVGVEEYTVGSNDFYLSYHGHARAKGIGNTIMNLDLGHFHCEENVADKISAVMLFSDKFMAHLTRGLRWDSDHVVINDEKTNNMMREIVRCGVLDNAFIGTDYFDASINRVAAWTIGTRATKKALLSAMLEPVDMLHAAEDNKDFTLRLALMDEFKSLPSNAVWEYYCMSKNIPSNLEWMADLKQYEKDVMFKR
ncbi:MAG: L-rhamnose isomerase [Bacteroides sp.]|nr:L-rhamnose isomerase [Bacteroides sp.]